MAFQDELIIDTSHLTGEGWGISEAEMDRYKAEIFRAAAAVETIRKTGKGPGGEDVLFPCLPYLMDEEILISSEEKERLEALTDTAKEEDVVISIGIGGSYLGNQALYDLFCGPYWNLFSKDERKGYPEIYFAGQNLDPLSLMRLEDRIHRSSHMVWWKHKVLLLINSKSGTTLEPIMAERALRKLLGSFCDLRVIAITDKAKGALHDKAEEEGWERFTVPEGIGGRFSVFSQVGLVFAKMAGIDTDAFLAGARLTEESCRSYDPKENPALKLATLKYLAKVNHKIDAEVIMPYGDSLRTLGWWYAQLLGESLGKKYDLQGNEIYYGRVPVASVGTTDMHSLTQEHQEGKKNKLVQFISVAEDDTDLSVLCDEGNAHGEVPLSYMLRAAQRANEEALAKDGRMSCSITMRRATPFHVGALMYFFFLTIAYEAALAGVNAFDQPGVEKYKKILHGDLKEYIEKHNGT